MTPPMRRKPPWEQDLIEMMDEKNEAAPTEEELEEIAKLTEYREPAENPRYDLVPERVVALEKQKYTRDEAYRRFAEIAASQRLVQINHKETPRHYIWDCLYERNK